MGLMAKALMYGRTFDCDFNSALFSCGVGSPYSGETILIMVGYHDIDPKVSVAVIAAWILLLLVIHRIIAYGRVGRWRACR
jgi:hypothetical protein